MKKREYSTKEVLAILDSNGYYLLRTTKGSHKIYSDGVHTISIPTKNKMVNKMLFARLVRENNLIIN